MADRIKCSACKNMILPTTAEHNNGLCGQCVAREKASAESLLETRDGIEIHYDEKRGYLSLACERDAFEPYREIVEEQLEYCEEIPIESVRELSILDVEAHVAWRDAPRKRVFDWVFGGVILAFFALAMFGAVTLIQRIIG